MPAYFVALRDSMISLEEFRIYEGMVASTFSGHEVRVHAAYGPMSMLEGEPIEGAVILEFPSVDRARAWYEGPAYLDALQHRLKAAKYRTFIVDGVPLVP